MDNGTQRVFYRRSVSVINLNNQRKETKMQAYLNDEKVKASLITQLQAHYDADEIVKGRYWEGGKGCAVGCTLHNSNHAAYETKLGIPEMLAWLEDSIFEGLPNDKAKLWPIRFSKAIAVGADLSRVGYQFMYWNLTENLVLKDLDNKEVQAVIIQCRAAIAQCAKAICPLTKGQPVDRSAAYEKMADKLIELIESAA